MCIDSMRTRLGIVAIPLQLPLGEGTAHRGVIDLVRPSAVVYSDGDDGRTFCIAEVPEEQRDAVTRARLQLIEACADVDGSVMETYLTHGPEAVAPEDLERAIRTATLRAAFVPVLCGSAYRNKGVQPLLDAVVKYLPSPGRHRNRGRYATRHGDADQSGRADDSEPLCARWRSRSSQTGTSEH